MSIFSQFGAFKSKEMECLPGLPPGTHLRKQRSLPALPFSIKNRRPLRPLPLKILATPLLRVAVVFNTSYYDNHSINMALMREKATQRAILLRKTVVLRYLCTSEVGWVTKLTLIRKVFKYNGLWKLYTSGN